MQNENNRPTLGLAFSGASARSAFYIGFLEVLDENKIKIDYISATSGSCIVAAAYACGTLSKLKKTALRLDKEYLFSLIKKSGIKNGLYSLDKVEEELRNYTNEHKFEDVRPLMGFVCTDIYHGKEVVLCMGDIAKAACASCAIPGIFEPIKWGNWDLVDGGLLSVVPGDAAKRADVDVVVGVNLSPNPRVFGKIERNTKRFVDFIKKVFLFNKAENAWKKLRGSLEKNRYFGYIIEAQEEAEKREFDGIFSVLGRAMDLVLETESRINRLKDPQNFSCDLLINPVMEKVQGWRRILYMHFADFKQTKKAYLAGRLTAKEYSPKINELLDRVRAGK